MVAVVIQVCLRFNKHSEKEGPKPTEENQRRQGKAAHGKETWGWEESQKEERACTKVLSM